MITTGWALNNCGLFSISSIYGSSVYGNRGDQFAGWLRNWSDAISRVVTERGQTAHRCLFSLAVTKQQFKTYSQNPGIAFLLRYSKLLWSGTNTAHGDNITYIFLMDLRPLVGTLIYADGTLLPPRYMSYRFRKYFKDSGAVKNLYKVKITRTSDGGKERHVASSAVKHPYEVNRIPMKDHHAE